MELAKKKLKEGGCDHQKFWILKRDQVEFQNRTSWKLEGRGDAYNECWIPKRPQKKPQNTNNLGLQKGGLNHHGFLDFLKNTKKSRNETVDRELEGKAWRSLGTNVLYSIHCTVQYHDGAFKGNRVDFSAVDNDIGRSLMIDVFNTEIHGNNCTRAKVTPDQKYCSNRQDKDQFTTREDKADVSPVVIRTSIDGSRIVDQPDLNLAAIDVNSVNVDELRTEIYEIDYMGPHLAPTCTGPERDYSDIRNGRQEVAIAEGHSCCTLGPMSTERWTSTDTEQSLCCSGCSASIRPIESLPPRCILSSRKSRKGVLTSLARTSEVGKLNDIDSAFNDGVHAQDNDPTTRKMPVFSSGFIVRVLTSDVSLQIETVDQQFTFDFTFKESSVCRSRQWTNSSSSTSSSRRWHQSSVCRSRQWSSSSSSTSPPRSWPHEPTPGMVSETQPWT